MKPASVSHIYDKERFFEKAREVGAVVHRQTSPTVVPVSVGGGVVRMRPAVETQCWFKWDEDSDVFLWIFRETNRVDEEP